MKKLLVCGGRDFHDREFIHNILDGFRQKVGDFAVISGGAPGADSLAAHWAAHHKLPYAVHAAQWDRHGKAAGPIRNQAMLDTWAPDCVCAFPGGRGTTNMINIAKKAGIKVIQPHTK